MAVKGQRSVWLAVEQGGETQQGEEKIADHSRVKAMIHSTGPIKEAEVSLGGKGGVVFLERSGVLFGRMRFQSLSWAGRGEQRLPP